MSIISKAEVVNTAGAWSAIIRIQEIHGRMKARMRTKIGGTAPSATGIISVHRTTKLSNSRLELHMSRVSGDTARANRIKTQRNKTRAKIQELRVQLEAKKAAAPAGAKPKT